MNHAGAVSPICAVASRPWPPCLYFGDGRFQRMEAQRGTHAELLLAFCAAIGLKPDFMTKGVNEKRTVWVCRVLQRVTHPAPPVRFKWF